MGYFIVTFPGGVLPTKRYDLDPNDPLTVGRSPENKITEGGNGLSRRHAVVSFIDSFPVIRDLGSANGTFVNGEQLTRPVILLPEDEVYCGEILFVYHEGS